MHPGLRGPGVTPFFRTIALPDHRKSMEAGRPIYTDVEFCEIRFAGSKDVSQQPTHSYSHWEFDEETREQRHLTYAERFPRQYQQYLSKQAQTKSGTPLDYVSFLTESKRLELRALNIYTIEALAELDGQPLKNLGMGGRELKNKAMDYLANSSHDAVIMKQQQQIDMLIAQIKSMQDEQKLLAHGPRDVPQDERPPPPPEPEDEPENEEDGEGQDELPVGPHAGLSPELAAMNRDELRAFIVQRSGRRPVGNPSMRNLVRMAQELA